VSRLLDTLYDVEGVNSKDTHSTYGKLNGVAQTLPLIIGGTRRKKGIKASRRTGEGDNRTPPVFQGNL